MKNDNKVFSIYILIILAFALIHYFDGVGFAFSSSYSDFGLGIIALSLFFSKKIDKYTFLLIPFGFSLLYLVASHPSFQLIDYSGFVLLKNLTLITFSLFVLWDLRKRKFKSTRLYLGLLSLLILMFFALRILDIDIKFASDFSFYKNCIGFVLIVWMLRINTNKSSFTTGLKRIIITIGLSFFIEMMSYLVTHY